ncbi:MAG: hypothetical protein ABIN97_16645 [Ginsengibacter sp.]
MNFSEDKTHLEVQNIVQEHEPDYQKAEMDLLRDALRRTHKERFLVATRLYKIQQMLSKATITHHS